MKLTIQKPTAEGVRYITLPDNILKAMGWKEGDTIYVEPVVPQSVMDVDGTWFLNNGTPSHVILEKR